MSTLHYFKEMIDTWLSFIDGNLIFAAPSTEAHSFRCDKWRVAAMMSKLPHLRLQLHLKSPIRNITTVITSISSQGMPCSTTGKARE